MRSMASTRRVGAAAAAGLIAALLIAGPAAARPPGAPEAARSLDICESADALAGDARAQALERGMGLAEQALAADEGDGLAHFAIVCNLGKQMEAAGLGIGQLMNLRRLKRAANRSVELAPDDADALAAKGALLLRLPGWLGGDRAEAEQLLRRAVAAEPHNNTARCYLAQALTDRGADDEARALQARC